METGGATSVEGCLCAEGQTPTDPPRNLTVRCQPCSGGTYKTEIGDMKCVETCPQHSWSAPGATGKEYCYCQENYFYQSSPHGEGVCRICPSEGVACKGGFSPEASLLHTEPESKPGFYLTGFSIAEECFTEKDSSSVCLPGATFQDPSAACAGDQTGILCGACQQFTAHDLGNEPCTPCDSEDILYVGVIVLDLVMKAGFGLFLGKQAMLAVREVNKMDTIILRILLQWITAVSVLQKIDLSNIPLYSWSQEQLRKDEMSLLESAARVFQQATDAKFRFAFPQEFMHIWNVMVAVKGSMPSLQSPQHSLECLLQRQSSPADLPSTTQLVVPALYWLMYPIFVVATAFLFCLVFAKWIWPVSVWLSKRAKMQLKKMLLAAGASPDTVAKALEQLNYEAAMELLEDPAALMTVQGLTSLFGEALCLEVAAGVLTKMAGGQVLQKVGQLLEFDDSNLAEEKKDALRAVQAGGEEGVGAFIMEIVKVMDKKEIAVMLTNQSADGLLSTIDSMPADELSAVVLRAQKESAQEDDVGGCQPFAEQLSKLSPAIAPQLSKLSKLSKGIKEDRVVFGLFRDSTCHIVFIDAYPLFLVTLYSIWDIETRRMLGLIQVKRILVSVGDMDVLQAHWYYDTRFQVLQGDHFWVGIIGIVGLCVWSIGFLVVLFWKIRKNKQHLQETEILIKYGYFYAGLDPKVYWWDVCAKKLDILCLYFVTFTEIFPDPKAKLVMYLGFAGVFWAAHNFYQPFDDRHNSLADRLEGAGLAVRFVTLFFLQTLLIVAADFTTNVIFSVLILLINTIFMASALFVLFVEMPAKIHDKKGAEAGIHAKVQEKGKAAGKKLSTKLLGGGSGHPVQQAIVKLVSCLFGYIFGKLFHLIVRAAAVLSSVRDTVEREVPHVDWRGPGKSYQLYSPDPQRGSVPRNILAMFMRAAYKLGEEEQRAFLAHTVGKFLDHLITTCECHLLPSNILDIIFALPVAHERAAEDCSDVPLHLRTARLVHSMVTMSNAGTAVKDECFVKEQQWISSAEDLNAALIWVRRMSKKQVREFMAEIARSPPPQAPSSSHGLSAYVEQIADPVPTPEALPPVPARRRTSL